MGKVHNILFTIVVAVICCTVIGSIAYSKIADTSDEPRKSTLEGRELEFIPSLTAGSFLNREYQDQMEQALADKIPCRSQVLLDNALVQRSLIKTANVVCRFPAYPTFFGSEYVYCPSIEAVYQAPASVDWYDDEFFDDVGGAISNVMDANQNLNWAYNLPDRANISLASPAYELTANSLGYPLVVEKLKERLPAACTFVTCSYTDSDTYAERFFKTDQHMQISGAIDSYTALMTAFGKEPIFLKATYKAADDFRGANARAGLIRSATDDVWTIEYDPEGISVKINGADAPLSKLDYGANAITAHEYRTTEDFANVYAEWFVGDYGLVEVHNNDPKVAGESLLIISDSYDNNQLMLYAHNYENVYSIDPRHYEDNIQAFIDAHPDIDDAAFIMSLGGLSFSKKTLHASG